MNTADRHGIGRMREAQVAELLRKKGFITQWWQPPRAKYRPIEDGGSDIFGLFDVIGVTDVGSIVFVQVKKLYCGQDDLKPNIEAWCKGLNPACHVAIVWYGTDPEVLVNGLPRLKEVRLEVLGWNDFTWYEASRWKGDDVL